MNVGNALRENAVVFDDSMLATVQSPLIRVRVTNSLRTDFTDLNLYCIKGALALVVLVSFSGYVC